MKKLKDESDLEQIQLLIQTLPKEISKKLNRILENKCSTWLSVTPTNDNHFALSPDESRSGTITLLEIYLLHATDVERSLIFAMH